MPIADLTATADQTTSSHAHETSIQVRALQPDDAGSWDAFVLRHPCGSPFHLIAWMRSIQATFPFQPLYRVAVADGTICGVLPLFLVKSFVTGKVLLSTPFAVYGGILAGSPGALEALKADIETLGRKLDVQYVELRNAYPEQRAGFEPITRYVTFTRPATPDSQAILQSLDASTRNKIRKSLKHPFQMRPSSDVRTLANLLALTYHRLGTPCFPLGHFQALLKHFGDRIDIREVVLDGQVVAASLNFLFRDQVHNFNSGSDARFNAMAPNNYMYFALLQWSGQNGFQVFDFGRSKKGSGPFEFKRHWGTTMRELPYEVLLIRRKSLPNFSPANPKFELAVKMWQRLPRWAADALGPRLIGLFP